MSMTVEATYEDGVFKPIQPLPLEEHERVRLTVEVKPNIRMEPYGIIGWTGDASQFDRLFRESEHDLLEGT